MTAGQLGDLIRRREVSPVEVTQTSLDRIQELNPKLNAFITVTAEGALQSARRAERAIALGRYRGPLHGIPFAVKDVLWTKGIRTTNGSRLFADFVPSEDATLVSRMKRAGGILLGKLNMMEIGFGPTLYPPYGTPKNPWDLGRTPGGSSSGSASSLASFLCPITLGGDAGGSIRLPASLCGVVGLKPTWSRLSRHGLFPAYWQYDTVGPMARTAADCALALQAIAGYDRKDPLSSRKPVDDYGKGLDDGIRGLRIGVVKEFMDNRYLQPETRTSVSLAIERLAELGATVDEVSIPLIGSASAIYVGTCEPEVAALFRPHLLSRSDDIDVLPRRRLLAASLIPGSLSVKAHRLRERLLEQVNQALTHFDLLAGPTSPSPASPIQTTSGISSKEDAWVQTLAGRSVFTNPFNLTGHPAISVPCGFSNENLPIGLQLIGHPFQEADILKAAQIYQSNTSWHEKRPPCS